MNNLKPYKNYKPSKFSWLGDIPEHWEMRKLKAFSSLKARIGFHGLNSTHFIDKGPFCITGTDFKNGKIDFKNCYHVADYWYNLDDNIKVQNGDILVTKDGTIGKVAIVDNLVGEATLNSGVFVLRPSINSRNLYWQLNSNVFKVQMDLIAKGSTINHLYERDFRNFFFTLPPLAEQQAIANYLDYKLGKIDRFIQKKKQLIKLLNEQKAGIINDAVTKGLNPNAKMKPSNIEWLGDIPEHWEVRKLKYVANCFPSNIDKHTRENETQVRLCNYTDVYKNDWITNDMNLMLATATDDQIEKFSLQVGDVIITKDSETADDIAVPALVKEELDNVVCGYHLSVLRPNANLLGEYLFRTLQCKPINIQFELCSNGVTRVGLGVYDLKKAEIPVPPLEEQKAIVQCIEQETAQINAVIQTIEKEIVLTQEYRVALIAEAVTGKIDVRDFEIPETPIVELYEELEEVMSLAAEEEAEYLTEN